MFVCNKKYTFFEPSYFRYEGSFLCNTDKISILFLFNSYKNCQITKKRLTRFLKICYNINILRGSV